MSGSWSFVLCTFLQGRFDRGCKGPLLSLVKRGSDLVGVCTSHSSPHLWLCRSCPNAIDRDNICVYGHLLRVIQQHNVHDVLSVIDCVTQEPHYNFNS